MSNLIKSYHLPMKQKQRQEECDESQKTSMKYVRFVKLGLADSMEIEKRFDKSWKRVQARAKKLNITQKDIEAEIRAVRTGK